MNKTVSSENTVGSNLNLRELPLGLDDFVAIRRDHKIYVDKTALIFKLLSSASSYVFLSRPRRFGKSLLISTFESLFKNGLQDFKGLAIEKLWHDKTYPVIRINFALCKSFTTLADFKSQMNDYVAKAFNKAGLTLPVTSDDVVSRIKDYFDAHEGDGISPVLLIDEYDAPLNNCLNNVELFEDIRRELNKLYILIKDISGKLRFFFFTGICKYKNLSIFSDNNYITDISMSPDYGTLLGYTDDEVREYFTPFVENAAQVLDISVDECFKKIKESYDGFCFDRKALTHVHTPWSVLSFLNSPQDGFMNYWYTSGGQPSLLLNYIAEHALRDINEYGKDQFITLSELDSSREVNNLNDYTLLYQTGYLTIKEALSPNTFILNYPNTEVATSMAQLYSEELFKGNNPDAKIRMDAYKLFATQSVDEIVDKLNTVLTGINYKSFPINNEASFQNTLLVYLMGGDVNAFSELANAHGRSDLEFAAGNRYFVLELKALDDRKAKRAPSKKIETLLDEAVTQIKEKHYGESKAQGRELIRIGLVFSLKHKSIVASASV